jgi:hypothetical protein
MKKLDTILLPENTFLKTQDQVFALISGFQIAET